MLTSRSVAPLPWCRSELLRHCLPFLHWPQIDEGSRARLSASDGSRSFPSICPSYPVPRRCDGCCCCGFEICSPYNLHQSTYHFPAFNCYSNKFATTQRNFDLQYVHLSFCGAWDHPLRKDTDHDLLQAAITQSSYLTAFRALYSSLSLRETLATF